MQARKIESLEAELDACKSDDQDAVLCKKQLDLCRGELIDGENAVNNLNDILRTTQENLKALENENDALQNQLASEKAENETLQKQIRKLLDSQMTNPTNKPETITEGSVSQAQNQTNKIPDFGVFDDYVCDYGSYADLEEAKSVCKDGLNFLYCDIILELKERSKLLVLSVYIHHVCMFYTSNNIII